MCIRAYIALKCLFFVAITQFGAIHNQSSGAFFTLWYFLRAKLHYELVSGVTVFPPYGPKLNKEATYEMLSNTKHFV